MNYAVIEMKGQDVELVALFLDSGRWDQGDWRISVVRTLN
jgi:hypothetical protein